MQPLLYKGCPVQFTMQFLAGKWKTGILWNLRERPMRFQDIKKKLPGIADKVLMQELRLFTDRGLVKKNTFREFPPRSEYTLSPLGLSLLPVIQQIIDWGYDHLQDEKINGKMFMTPMSTMEELALSAASL